MINHKIKILILFALLINPFDLYAKDLYVSTTGSDSVTYANNSISSPWATPQKAFYNALAGDTVYFRGGTYTITSQINTAYYGHDGTSSNPIVFRGYKKEVATLKSSLDDAIMIDRNYITISNFTIVADHRFIHVADTNTVVGFKMLYCNSTLTQQGGSTNECIVTLQASRANGAVIQNCIFNGPGGTLNPNTAGIFIWRTENINIKFNEFYNFPSAVFYKHTGNGTQTGSSISYNYFQNCDTGIRSVGQYIEIRNNLLVNSSMMFGEGGGLGDSGQNNGGDHNTIIYNTIYNGKIELLWVSDGDGSGCQYNTIKYNVFTKPLEIHRYNSGPHYSVTDYNVYNSSYAVYGYGKNYTYTDWKTVTPADTHSVAGTPIFSGGSSPSAKTDFTLTSTSPGYHADGSGSDLGIVQKYVGKMNDVSNFHVQ